MSADELSNGPVRVEQATQVVNLDRVLESFEEVWAPRLLAQVNDYGVKVARVQGDYVWHSHEDTDELFIVLSGQLEIGLRDAGAEWDVVLDKHDVYVVPRGMQHRPRSAAGAVLMLVEPLATLSTGDYAGRVPARITATTGLTIA